MEAVADTGKQVTIVVPARPDDLGVDEIDKATGEEARRGALLA